MNRKASFDTPRRRSSAGASTASSTSTISSVRLPTPKIKVYSPDGTDLSSTITRTYRRITVTIREKGKKPITRILRTCYGDEYEDNKYQEREWHYSMVDASDRDPTGKTRSTSNTTKECIDPGRLPCLYSDRLECLEVVIGQDGKWMIRPIAIEKRQAIHKVIEQAEANDRQIQASSKQARINQALSLLKATEEQELLQKARRERKAARQAKAEEAAQQRKEVASAPLRQNSNDSTGSIFKNKGAHISVHSLTSTRTSSTLTLPHTKKGQASSLRQKLHLSRRFGKKE